MTRGAIANADDNAVPSSAASELFRQRLGLSGHTLRKDDVPLLQRFVRLIRELLRLVVRLLADAGQLAIVDRRERLPRSIDRRADGALGAGTLGRAQLRRGRSRRRGWWEDRRRLCHRSLRLGVRPGFAGLRLRRDLAAPAARSARG